MTWESLKSILPLSIKNAGLKEQITSQNVLLGAEKILKARWGEDQAQYISFVSFKDGVLNVSATSPAAMQVLKLEKINFINAVNHLIGERAVLKIEIRSNGF